MVFGAGNLLGKIFLPGFANAGADTSFQTKDHPSDMEEESLLSDVLTRFAPKVWIAEGPVVSFFGFPYPTRMVAIRLSDGSAWIWSPTALTAELAIDVEKIIGPVRYIVSPNSLHWLYLKEWQDRFPEAKVFATPGLIKRKVVRNVRFDATLTDQIPSEFSEDMEQILFEGGTLDEVVFYHKPSKTVIFCDLIQRHFEDEQKGWKGWLMRADGVVGPLGSTPKEWAFMFWVYGKLPATRKKLDHILNVWQPEGMVIAHGELAPYSACVVIENCASWVPKEPKECCCCRPE